MFGIGSELLRCRRQLCAAPAISVQATCKTVTKLLHCPTILEVVCTPRQDERLQIFHQLHSPCRIGKYLRFWLACSTLPVAICRRDSTPRHMRHCQQCSTAAVGEEGISFSSAQQRSTFATVFGLVMGRQSMRGFVTQTDQAAAMERARELSHHVASPEGLKGCQPRGWNPSLLS